MTDNKEEEKEQLEQMEEKSQTEVNIEVKQMLKVESKYCTRIRHTTSMKSPVPITSPIVREDIPVPDARVFLLHNLLTPSECAHYIAETEEICYRDLRSEFEESYRSNERLLVLSETLADYLWRRMQPHLHRNDVVRVRPMCFGNGGSWLPQRLNECFKFGKYQKKQHFGSHIDGPWVPRADESSIYTVLIYLNDNFEGGETVFTPPAERAKLDQEIADTRQSIEAGMTNLSISSASSSASISGYHIDPSTGKVTILPRQGTALIFTHDTLHAGLPILAGKKYVLRTEIMFTRRDSDSIPASIRESYQSDPNYQQTVIFYMDSYAKSLKGDVPGFTNSYLAALKLQHEAQFSVSKDTKAIHELNLPLSLYVHLFTFLDLKDLISALQCSKSFKDISKDGSLWKQLYRICFPLQVHMESYLQQQQRLFNQSSSINSSTIPTPPSNEQAIPITPKDSVETKDTKRLLKQKQQNTRIKSHKDLAIATKDNTKTKPIKKTHPNTRSRSRKEDTAIADMKRMEMQEENTRIQSRLDFGPIDPAIQDWYTIFKQRVLLQSKFEPVIFDFGSFSTKCTLTTPSDTPVLELLNLVAVISGLHDIHCRRGAHERFLTGLAVRQETRHGGYRCAKHVIVKGQPDEQALLPELIAPNLLQLSVWSYQHPMIIAEPPFRWEKSTRIKLMKHLFAIFRLPALCFVNSAVLSLMSQGLDSGLVAHVGHDTAWVVGIYRRRMISFFDFTPNLESPNAAFNSTYSMRRNQEDDDEMVKDGTLTPQAQVTPEELAIRTADTYLDMLAQITDEHHHINFHQIVLCGGGTIDQGFREKYQHSITVANTTRRHADIVKIRETMLKNSNIATNIATDLGSAVPTPTGYIHDLVVILPHHPTHTEVEGGKIFGGLSMFQQHCIRRFEAKNHSDRLVDARPSEELFDPFRAHDDGDDRSDDFLEMHKWMWRTDEWLRQQETYFAIKENFHLDEDTGDYIANSSCSDDEVERILHETGVMDVDDPPPPTISTLPALIWRRRRLQAKSRGPTRRRVDLKFADEDDDETSASKSVAQGAKKVKEKVEEAAVEVKTASPMKPDPQYPMRRTRRSAFPILSPSVVKWFQYQINQRCLADISKMTRHQPPPKNPTEAPTTTTEQKDEVQSEDEDEDEHAPLSPEFIHPHFQADISTLFEITRKEDPDQPFDWRIQDFLGKVREFRRTKGHRTMRLLAPCQTRTSTTKTNTLEEELEDWNEPEEFVEEPIPLVQWKLDHFRGLQSVRRLAASFPSRHLQPYPSNSVTHFKFALWLNVCCRIPDGGGGEMAVAFRLPNCITVMFMTYELKKEMVATVIGVTDDPKSVIDFGLLLDCRVPIATDPPQNDYYPCDPDSDFFYLFTRPILSSTGDTSSSSSSTSTSSLVPNDDLAFLCHLSWNNGNMKPRDVIHAARKCIQLTKKGNPSEDAQVHPPPMTPPAPASSTTQLPPSQTKVAKLTARPTTASRPVRPVSATVTSQPNSRPTSRPGTAATKEVRALKPVATDPPNTKPTVRVSVLGQGGKRPTSASVATRVVAPTEPGPAGAKKVVPTTTTTTSASRPPSSRVSARTPRQSVPTSKIVTPTSASTSVEPEQPAPADPTVAPRRVPLVKTSPLKTAGSVEKKKAASTAPSSAARLTRPVIATKPATNGASTKSYIGLKQPTAAVSTGVKKSTTILRPTSSKVSPLMVASEPEAAHEPVAIEPAPAPGRAPGGSTRR